MSRTSQHAAVMALLTVDLPDREVAAAMLGIWRRLPELSDTEAEEVVLMWDQARTHGFFAFVVGPGESFEPGLEPWV